jgi:ribose transport system substrate-binding protein
MQRSRTLTIGVAIATITLMSACSSGGTPKASTSADGAGATLAGIAFNAQDPYWVTLMCGATKQAKADGATIKWRASNTTSVTDQQAAFQAVQLEAPDALILAPFQPATFSTSVGDMMKKGTPVIGVNAPITPATEYQLIESDTDNSDFASFVAKDLGTTTGTMAILGGAPGIPAVDARWEPIVKALKETAPNITVLPTQYDDFDRNKASAAASALIVANPDLKAIYAVSGPEGEGAAAAVTQAGKSGVIKVYSYDATPAEVTALKAGTITALLAQPAGDQGAQAVKTALSVIKSSKKGQAITPASEKIKLIPLKVLTKDNIAEASSAGYIYSATCEG